MTVPIFVGPTLRPEEIAAIGEFVLLPPVAPGDVYRAARRKPRAIGVIDGYFSGAASAGYSKRSATGGSKTTMRWRSYMGRRRSAISRRRRRWLISARHSTSQ